MLKILILAIVIESILPLYYLFMKYLSKKENKIDKKYWYPNVSIIIPTFNEEDTILLKLKNMLELNYPLGKIEILVVDGYSTDRTASMVKKFQNEFPNLNLAFIQESKRCGKTKSINNTVPHCKGELICITDSDCLWDKNALKEAAANFFDNKIGAVTGLESLLDKKELSEKLEENYNEFYNTLRIGESVLDSTPIIRGPLMIFRSFLLKSIEVGTDSPLADDSEIAVKIRKMGYRVIAEPKAVIYVFAPPTIGSSRKQKSRRGLGLIKLFLSNFSVILDFRKYKYYSLICAANLFSLIISPILVLFITIMFLIELSYVQLRIIYIFLLLSVLFIVIQNILLKNRIAQFIYSFLHSQFSLLITLPYVASSETTWDQITEVRAKWNKTTHDHEK